MAELVTKYQQYAEYKDSGVEWLGKIPNHWEVVPIKHLAILNPKKSTLSQDLMSDECSFVPMEKLKFNSLVLDEKKVIKDVYDGYTYFENEDILVAKVTPCFENNNTTIAKDLINGVGFGSSEIFVLRVNNKVNNRYLFYRLLETIFISVATAAMTGAGGLRRVPAETINTYSIAVPNVDEQTQIANFLDNETAQIDTQIEKQQTLIKLLKEKRQAVISHAVTKGLNPDAPMKDSGVVWLGEVPEHWEVMPLKYAVTFQRGHDLPAQNRTAGDVPLVTSAGISSTHNIAIAKAPGLVTGRYGTIGKFNLLEEDYWPLNTTLYSINLRGNNPKYLWYMLHNLTPIFLANSLKSAVPGVDRNDLHVVKVAMPKNLAEQEALCDYLEKTHCKYDLVIDKASESLVLLQERRTALISAAVTGKIDVRGWEAPDSGAL